jgi:glyoxylase-like metal-dependent hydrolase (beta-lactamase superfamily II)
MDEPTIQESPGPEESWESLAQILKIANPLFESTLFLLGYEFSSNVYAIRGKYLSIIDPGNDYTAFMELFELGFTPADVGKIALTHGHVDHCMGTLELFRGYPGVLKDLEVILHEAGPQEFKELARGAGCRLTEVTGGESLDLSGFEFEVIHTPGHTLDGLCFYHGASRTLFSGDTVLPHAMAEVDKEGGGRMDHYLYAIRTLLKKDVEHVMPGHGPLVPNIGRKVIQDTFEGLIKKVVGLETPWMEGAMTLAQQGLLEEALFYSNKELAAHPDNLRALEMKAFMLHDLGRSTEAAEFFDRVLAQKADHLYALMGKGSVFMALGQYEDSLECFAAVLKIQPQLKEALINKGLALYMSGKPEEAMEIEAFREVFVGRLKDELLKRNQAGPSSAGP